MDSIIGMHVNVFAFLTAKPLIIKVRTLVLASLATAKAFLFQAVRVLFPGFIEFPGPVFLEVIAKVHGIIFLEKG